MAGRVKKYLRCEETTAGTTESDAYLLYHKVIHLP